MAFTIVNQGSFLSAGVPVNITVQSGADYFKTINLTQLAATPAGQGVFYEWFGNPTFPANAAVQTTITATTGAAVPSVITTGGFNYVTSYPQPEAAYTGTGISKAAAAVVSGFTALPYNNGDNVILYGTTGMEILGGATFTISSVSSTQFSLIGLDTSGFASVATAVKARRVSPYLPVLPEFLYVSAITNSAQAIVTVTQDPTNTIYVGQKLVFQIPASFGMVELNNVNSPQSLPAVVTAVNYATYQFAINVDTSSFTPFAWPASTGVPATPAFATVAPAGCATQYNPQLQTYTGYDINKQPFRSSLLLPFMHLQAGANSPAGQNNDVIVWQSFKMEAPQYIVV